MVIAASVIAASLAFADVHGEVVSVDRAHNLLVVHHHAHDGMMAEMMMAVKMRDPRTLGRVRKGEFVRLRCETRSNPLVCEKR